MSEAILSLNAGSSSVKFARFEVERTHALIRVIEGEVDAMGSAPHFAAHNAAGEVLAQENGADAPQDFAGLMAHVLAWIETQRGSNILIGAGHRVVHGGAKFRRTQLVTAELLARLDTINVTREQPAEPGVS